MHILTAVHFVMTFGVDVHLYKNGIRVLLGIDYDDNLYYEVKDGKYLKCNTGYGDLENDINHDVDGWDLGEEDREKVLGVSADALNTMLDVFKELKIQSALLIEEALNSLR